jgi:hypothetical protein
MELLQLLRWGKTGCWRFPYAISGGVVALLLNDRVMSFFSLVRLMAMRRLEFGLWMLYGDSFQGGLAEAGTPTLGPRLTLCPSLFGLGATLWLGSGRLGSFDRWRDS